MSDVDCPCDACREYEAAPPLPVSLPVDESDDLCADPHCRLCLVLAQPATGDD
jgi:hypothetical protein